MKRLRDYIIIALFCIAGIMLIATRTKQTESTKIAIIIDTYEEQLRNMTLLSGKQLDIPYILVNEDIDTNVIQLKNRILIYISKNSCTPCIKTILETMNLPKNKVFLNNTLFLYPDENKNRVELFKKKIGITNKIYRIKAGHEFIKSGSFILVINKNGTILNPLSIDNQNLDIVLTYFDNLTDNGFVF